MYQSLAEESARITLSFSLAGRTNVKKTFPAVFSLSLCVSLFLLFRLSLFLQLRQGEMRQRWEFKGYRSAVSELRR